MPDQTNENIEFDLFITDLNGNLRGKRIPGSGLKSVLRDGVKLPQSVIGFDHWGDDVLENGLVFETGDSDGVCLPVHPQPIPVPWAESPREQILAMMYNPDGTPFLTDPRQILANIVRRFAELGYTPVVATELEFYLLDGQSEANQRPKAPIMTEGHGRRLVDTECYSIEDMDGLSNFFADVRSACQVQGIPADTIISELGPGQFEINMKHVNDAMLAADHANMFKRLVKGIARNYDYCTTFMAKPYAQKSGNGFHVHFSLLDKDGINVFDDGGEAGTQLLQHAIAGVMQHMADSMLIFAPHLNSYRRFQSGAHAPTFACWGYENRTVAIRVPESPPEARRLEHRVAGADANPYLVLAAILAAALDGIEHKMMPPEPVQGDAYAIEDEQPSLPTRWGQATDILKQSRFLQEYFGESFVRVFSAAKEQEQEKLASRISDVEYEAYL